MAKDFIINTDNLNSYGTRFLTAGVDIAQFGRNSVLLYMHQRGFDGRSTPIGRVENIRVEDDKLKGTPVFDTKDAFAAEIARKWDEGFLRMCSAGLEPIEWSDAPEHLLPGQTRATVTRSKLIEVSIVDIGANDEALQLYESSGKILKLAAGVDNDLVPLLKLNKQPAASDDSAPQTDKPKNNFKMDKILITLGLAATATEEDAIAAITKLKENAAKADTIELARITTLVENAINKDKKVTADKRETLLTLGKTSGYDMLASTLDMIQPARKPNDIIAHGNGGTSAETMNLSYSKLPEEKLIDLRENNRPEYIRLYKAEFGFDPILND